MRLGQQLRVQVNLVVAMELVSELGVELREQAGLDQHLGALIDTAFALFQRRY